MIVKLILVVSMVICPLSGYQIGVGIADCTGPAADVVFMGYAKSSQKGCGIHLRQYSRAFIFDDGSRRAVFVSVDAGMMALGVHDAVLKNLENLYNATYTDSNVMLSGTHTHGAPGGYLMDFMYDIPSFGFVRDTFDALVTGITKSIIRAHDSMVEGRVFLTKGLLLGTNVNRSPTSYLLNPEEERARYEYNVDKEMVQLKLIRAGDGVIMGAINWFPVHPTSMNNTNCLITSDNVGYASVLLEKSINGKDQLIGRGPFVGAFASTNLGDVSPNLKGGRCTNTGEICDLVSSTCDGQAKYCVAEGPGEDMFESTRIIAEKLFYKAKSLLETTDSIEATGAISHIQKFVDMPKESATIRLADGSTQQVHGCLPAMGYSFAAGTTDGPGEFDFKQGTKSGNSYWNAVRDLLFKPTEQDVECHAPKPILINTGRISTPYEWQPRIVSTQLIQLGNVILIAVPGEFTTMSGRRLRKAVKEAVSDKEGEAPITPIIAGLSNVYTSYITTPEEYALQRYEGASTIFGPHTLTLYLNIYKHLAEALSEPEGVGRSDPGPRPPNFSKLLSFAPGVMFDAAGLTNNYGDCIQQPPERVKRGQRVTVKFVSGHPRNNLMQESTFLEVQKLTNPNNWSVIATDADWETKFIWKRTSSLFGGSEAIVEWKTTPETPPGRYRIEHRGYYKGLFGGGGAQPYHGISNEFEVV